MATKVGAFKKDGTVQCVKLVEENTNPFSGTYENGVITFNSGLTIKFEYTGTGSSWSPLTNLVSITSISIHSSIGMSISVDANAHTAKLNGIQNPGTNSYVISNLGIIITPATSYICRCTVSYGDTSSEYRGGGTSSTSIIFNPYQSSSFTITPEMQVMSTSVKFGKDGTLKCKELIEETAVEDSSRLSMSQKTDALTLPYFNYDIRFINPGGQPLTIPSSYSELGYVTLLDSSGTQLNFSRSYSGGNNWTSSKNPSWTSGTVSIVRFTVSGTIKDSASQIAFVDNGTKQTQSARIIYFTKGSDGYYSNTSTPVTFNYDWLLKTPTVRVYKDGTIKCAEVEEATLTPKIGNGDWFEMTRSSASSGTFNFYGGQWTMTVEGPNGGSPTLFQTVSTIYAQVPLLPSGQPDNTIQWVGPPPYTTYYPSIYDEANYNRDGTINVNRIVVFSTTSMEGYKITINDGKNTLVYEWHLFTGTSNAFEPVGEQQWELTESDRFTYSWD